MSRKTALASALEVLGKRIVNAARAANRDPGDITLLPVTKFFPAADVAILHSLGCRQFGESRDQDAARKIAELPALLDVRWHMIGRLQRNKVRSVARWADTVQSVDSVRLAAALAAAVDDTREAGIRPDSLPVLVQVSLDDDPRRGGARHDEVAKVADFVAAAPALTLAGIMAVAPLEYEPERAFAELARVHELLCRSHPNATERSAGMSADLEIAVEYGSTCVRVGTALMGPRPIISP